MLQQAVKEDAKSLCFQADRELTATAANIALVLSYITDSTKDLAELPFLHHSYLFSSNRRELAWSAFGSLAPSFRVPSGKAMRLDQPFNVSIRTGVGKAPGPATREVKSIAAHIVPLDLAVRHLDEVIRKKEVLNPFGNASVRVSESNLNKVFNGESCALIVAGLRKLSGSVIAVSGGSKRRDIADEDESRKKKARYAF
jgi:hypothetical protein